MRKFLLPIINLVNIILVSITFGLGSKTAVIDGNERAIGSYYQLVWNPAKNANVLGIVGFFLFVVAVALLLVCFLPLKCRKFMTALTGLMLVAAGVMFLRTPASCDVNMYKPELTGALIAMAVLVFVAGALTLLMSVIEFTEKEEK